MKLEQEAERATELLNGKVVVTVWRHSEGEIGIEFADGTRLFVNAPGADLEVSITGGR